MRRRESGAVLIFVLLVMIIMFLAASGVMRSADTANVLAGNFAFKEAAAQASDRAVTDALDLIATSVSDGNGNNAVPNKYLPVIDVADPHTGLPQSVDWNAVVCNDEKGVRVTDCAPDSGGYRVQFVVERMCSGSPNFYKLDEIRGMCAYDATTTATDAQSLGVHYRVIVRVRGPRGTESWFESMVSGPAMLTGGSS